MTRRQVPVEGRVAATATAAAVSTAVAAILQLVSVPIVLNYWGTETYGAWLYLIAGYMMLRTTDAGYISFVGNQLNLQYHDNDVGLRASLGGAFYVCLILGALQTGFCILLISGGWLSWFFGVEAGLTEELHLGGALLVLVMAWVLSGAFLSVVHRLLVPAGMMYQSMWWALGYQVSQVTGLVLAVVNGATIFQAAVLYASVQGAVYVVSAVYVQRKLPEFYPWWKGASLCAGFRDLRGSLALSANAIAQQATTSGVILLVASGLGATAVATFATMRTLANLWTSLGNVLVSPLLPEIVRYHVKNEPRKLGATLRAHAVLGGGLLALSAVAVLPWIEDLYNVWTRGKLVFDGPVFLWLLVTIAAWNATAGLGVYLQGINSVNAQLSITLVRAVVTFGVGIPLVGGLGLLGLVLALLAGELFSSLGVGTYLSKRLMIGRWGYSEAHNVFPGLGAPFALLGLAFYAMAAKSLPTVAYIAALMWIGSASYVGWRGLDIDVRERIVKLLLGHAR